MCGHCGFANTADEKFCGGCGKPIGTAPVPAAAPAPTESQTAAVHRHLTVLFCDLVGSTALSARLDPETMTEVLVAYRDACVEAVKRFDGYPGRYVGDGLLVYFGYPQAHEDDPQRAVRAALEIVKAMHPLNERLARAAVSLSVRIGINTGMVVVGDIGHGDRVEKMGVVGEIPNIAARLQALAEPNGVLLGENTYQLVKQRFACEALGLQQIKGISQPLGAYRVLHEIGVQSRLEAQDLRALAPLIGRDEEISILLKRWRQAAAGEGQVVMLTGEPGVGKSSLLRGFQDRIRSESKSRVLYFCSPYHQDTPYYPVIEQLERSLRLGSRDSSTQKLAALEAMLQQLGLPLAKLVPPLASLLALPLGPQYPATFAATEDRRKRTLEALLLVLEGMAQRDPVLMLVEDLQWVDPSSMEMLKMLAEWLAAKRILLVCTHRLGFEPSWQPLPHITSVKLNRLDRRECTALAASVAHGKALPEEVLAHIIDRADGIPLFVEELTKTVLESGLLKDAGERYLLSGPLPAQAIPASLQDSLMARLDRLAPANEVAQLAAALGRRFTQELLAAVSRVAETTLNQALSTLVDAELVYRRGLVPEVVYEFKHALVREAAYNSLLRSKRMGLHVEIARILEEQFPQAVAASPEILSHHFQSAGLPQRAIPYSLKAGDAALARYASAEAGAHYHTALEMADALPASEAAARLQIQAILKLTSVSSKREHFERDLQHLERARALALSTGEREQLCRILYWIGRMNYVAGRFDQAVDYAEQALLRAAELGEQDTDSLTADPVNLLARIHCLRGEPKKATHFAARNVEQMQRIGNRIEEAAVSGVLAFAHGVHGHYRPALDAADHGVHMARSLEHLPTMAACYMFRAVVNGWFGKIQVAHGDFEQALSIAERTGDIFRRYLAHGWRAEAYLVAEDCGAAERDLEQCIALGNQIGTSFHRGAFHALLGTIKLHRGEIGAARHDAEEALAIAADAPWSRSIALRIHAETLLAAKQAAKAEAAVRAAIEIQEERECRRDLAWSQLTLGEVLQAKGDSASAAVQLLAASRAFEDMGITQASEKSRRLWSLCNA